MPNGSLSEIPPPEEMSDAQKALWHSIVGRAPGGVLSAIEREIMIEYVELFDRYETAVRMQRRLDQDNSLPLLTKGPDGKPIESPYLAVINKCILLLTKLQTQLGFTPSARARIITGVPKDEPADEWGQLYQLRAIPGGKHA